MLISLIAAFVLSSPAQEGVMASEISSLSKSLRQAIHAGDVEACRQFLLAGADPNARVLEEFVTLANGRSDSDVYVRDVLMPIAFDIHPSNREIFRVMLLAGMNPNMRLEDTSLIDSVSGLSAMGGNAPSEDEVVAVLRMLVIAGGRLTAQKNRKAYLWPPKVEAEYRRLRYITKQ